MYYTYYLTLLITIVIFLSRSVQSQKLGKLYFGMFVQLISETGFGSVLDSYEEFSLPCYLFSFILVKMAWV